MANLFCLVIYLLMKIIENHEFFDIIPHFYVIFMFVCLFVFYFVCLCVFVVVVVCLFFVFCLFVCFVFVLLFVVVVFLCVFLWVFLFFLGGRGCFVVFCLFFKSKLFFNIFTIGRRQLIFTWKIN